MNKLADDICYVEHEMFKALTVLSPTFTKLFIKERRFLPAASIGLMMGNNNNHNHNNNPIPVAHAPPNDKTTITKEPFFGDKKALNLFSQWCKGYLDAVRENRTETVGKLLVGIVGANGCGKTFLLQHVCKQYGLTLKHVSFGDLTSKSFNNQLHNLLFPPRRSRLWNQNCMMTELLYLTDIELLPSDWLHALTLVLTEEYQKKRKPQPIIIEMTASEFYNRKWEFVVHNKTTHEHFKRKESMFSGISKFPSFQTIYVDAQSQPQQLLRYINWIRNLDPDSQMYKPLALAANGNYFRARDLLFDPNVFDYVHTALPTFQTFWNLGRWLIQYFSKTKRNAFQLARMAKLMASHFECTHQHLYVFFRNWIEHPFRHIKHESSAVVSVHSRYTTKHYQKYIQQIETQTHLTARKTKTPITNETRHILTELRTQSQCVSSRSMFLENDLIHAILQQQPPHADTDKPQYSKVAANRYDANIFALSEFADANSETDSSSYSSFPDGSSSSSDEDHSNDQNIVAKARVFYIAKKYAKICSSSDINILPSFYHSWFMTRI